MGIDYKKAQLECKKLSIKHGEDDINAIANLVKDIAAHEMLKNCLFKVSIWMGDDAKNDISKHQIFVVKGNQIIETLQKFVDNAQWRFDMVLFENN